MKKYFSTEGIFNENFPWSWFFENFENFEFWKHIFENIFLHWKKDDIFFSDNYIDVKFSEESIFRILGAIWQVFPNEILSQRENHDFSMKIHYKWLWGLLEVLGVKLQNHDFFK